MFVVFIMIIVCNYGVEGGVFFYIMLFGVSV